MLVCTLADTSLVKKLGNHQTAGKMKTISRRSSEAKKVSYNPTKHKLQSMDKKFNFKTIIFNDFLHILVKISANKSRDQVKQIIKKTLDHFDSITIFRSCKVNIDVDPY